VFSIAVRGVLFEGVTVVTKKSSNTIFRKNYLMLRSNISPASSWLKGKSRKKQEVTVSSTSACLLLLRNVRLSSN
jgi:hypothetical protein